MKKRLITTLISVSLLSLLLMGSSWRRPYSAKKIGGHWQIQQLNGQALRSGHEEAPHIIFEIGKGRINGYAYCNSFGGDFTINNDGSCSIKNILSTRVGCPENKLEQDLFITLEKTKKIIVSKQSAYLYNNTSGSGEPLLVLVRH